MTQLEGIDPACIPYTIEKVPDEFASDPIKTIENPDARIRAKLGRYIDARWELKYFKWNEQWIYIDRRLLAQVFNIQELYRLWAGTCICSDLSRYIEKEHPLLRKVHNSLWQYGYSERNINRIADCMEGLKRLRVDLPDFDLRITHTRGINTHAWALHVERGLYLDASFGVLLYYKGKHVLTCGFALAKDGILVAQVQLREKKGNRFLYKLPKHYVDFMLDILGDAFGRETLWFVEGRSAVEAIREAYGGLPCGLTPEDADRIAGFYNRPLGSFRRTRARIKCQGRTYIKLRPKAVGVRMAA